MTDQLENESLVLDLVAWVAEAPRSYRDVMDAWRTSCLRLTIWEDASDRGYVVTGRDATGESCVTVTAKGRAFLIKAGRSPT